MPKRAVTWRSKVKTVTWPLVYLNPHWHDDIRPTVVSGPNALPRIWNSLRAITHLLFLNFISIKYSGAPSVYRIFGFSPLYNPFNLNNKYVMFTRAPTRKSRHQRRCCDSGYCYSKLHRALSWPMKVVDCLVKKALAFTSERNWQLVYVISEEGRRCTIGLGWVILFYWLIFGSPV